MTVDLNEHMEKKKQERHIKAYDTIGEALDGMTVGTVLHILSVFTKTVLDNMEEPKRSQAAMVFSSVIMETTPKPKETVQ
jgi:hypothetical protein